MVALTVDPSSESVTPMTTVNVGGGTWSYGTGLASNGLKACYSNYVHPSAYHSSTAVIGAANVKNYANAGSWSNSYATNGWAYTCYTYWATY
jgi:hypothetical protein